MHRSKWQSPSGIWEKSNSERRGKREERREKRDGSVPEGRDGREKGRALGETREERKEKREDPCRNNEQLNCNRVCTFPGRAAAKEERREKREERREKREERREITKKAARDPQIDCQQGFLGPWAASNRFIFTVQNASGPHNPLQKCRDPVPRVERRGKER